MNEQTPNLASRGARLGGALIDAVISLVVIIPMMLLMGILADMYAGLPMTFNQQIILFVVAWSFFLVINGYLLYTRGQTIGKLIVKTKIVDLNGNLPGFGKLFLLRYIVFGLLAQIPIVGELLSLVNALFIFREDHRCLHDHLAGTRVVYC